MKIKRSWAVSTAFFMGMGVIILLSQGGDQPASQPSPLWMNTVATLVTLPQQKPHDAAPEAPQKLLSSFQLSVPFTAQAPHGYWGMPYQEACEEASIIMALRYARGRSIASVQEADTDILTLVRMNAERYGDSVDESLEEVQALMKEVDSSVVTRIVENPSVDDLKRHLVQGSVVIVPVIGWQLKNPYFSRPDVPYHMLVLTGYDGEEFITNEPGTKNGEGYRYTIEVVMSAMHDLHDPLEEGGKAVLIVEPVKG